MTAAIEARMAASRASMNHTGISSSNGRPSGTRSSLGRVAKGFESFDSCFDPEFGGLEDERMRPPRPVRGAGAAKRMSNASEQSQGKWQVN
jgi:hypothetical protein